MNSSDYEKGLENLQYDLLYGKRFAYNGKDLYPATNIVMGIDDVTVSNAKKSIDGSQVIIEGKNFTKWSRVYINGTKVDTDFSSDKLLTISSSDIKPGDKIVVNQLGSSNTIFRSSNEYKYSGK